MPLASYLGLVLASVPLPGPNVAILVGHGLADGRPTGLAHEHG